jgi:glycosyltransferase involved in cell wall biosynthesis
MDRISVIITNYNYERTLRRAVQSVLASSWPNTEVIVVDDGSTDQSILTIRDYVETGRVRLIRKDNGGQADARDTGVRNASGEWISFLDADDEIDREKLTRQHGVVQDYGKDCIVMTGSWVVDPDDRWSVQGCSRAKNATMDITEDYAQGRVRPSEATLFLSRRLYFEIGGFWTAVRRQAILEFFSRVIARGLRMVLVNRPLYIEYEHPTSNRHRSSYRTDSIRQIFHRIEQRLSTCRDANAVRNVTAFMRSRSLLLWFASLTWDRVTRNEVLVILAAAPWGSRGQRMLFAVTRQIPAFLLLCLRRLWTVGKKKRGCGPVRLKAKTMNGHEARF